MTPPSGTGPSDAAVEVCQVRHAYGDDVVLETTDLAVRSGEFCTLLGASGAGKTTLLKIVAGLLRPTSGTVHIGGRDVTGVNIQDRNIGFVFQHYALFPHLTVRQNIEYPLRIRRVPGPERARRVDEVLRLIALADQADRRPSQISGGQQQRVAVGRALVYGPEVLLLDEPLGALDRRLRQQLGADLRRIQRAAGITALYVTHDQEEAFVLSDTIVVMSEGRIRQAGAGPELYAAPRDAYVASFLGDTNLVPARVVSAGANGVMVATSTSQHRCETAGHAEAGSSIRLSIRPEELRTGGPASSDDEFLTFGRVDQLLYLGSRLRLHLTTDLGPLVAELPVGDPGTTVELGDRLQIWCRRGSPFVLAALGSDETGGALH